MNDTRETPEVGTLPTDTGVRRTPEGHPYVICFIPRNGSTLLCEALLATGRAGKPKEYFQPPDVALRSRQWGLDALPPRERDAAFLNKVLDAGSTPNGVFGAKASLAGLENLHRMLRTRQEGTAPAIGTAIEQFLPGVRYIFITRRDKARQAVSMWKLEHQRVPYKLGDEEPTHSSEPVYNYTRINRALQGIVVDEGAWNAYFESAAITPFSIVYEDLVGDYAGTIRRVLAFLEIPNAADVMIPPPRLRKQADSVSEEWARRYWGDHARYIRVSALPQALLRQGIDLVSDIGPLLRRREADRRLSATGRDWEAELQGNAVRMSGDGSGSASEGPA